MTVPQSATGRLERLCGTHIKLGRGGRGVERAEAYLHGQAFAPHRHDSYAIGITLAGVQRFRYRGEQHQCLPGQCHILHPDELHDGAAGTEAGFAYRIIYLDPVLIQQAMDGAPLPFARTPVVDASLLPKGFAADAWDLDAETGDVAQVDLAVAATNLLVSAASGATMRRAKLDVAAISRVRERIAACPATRSTMPELERIAGLDRWTLARQFRAMFGTSPGRFRILRQLDQVRRMLLSGTPLVAASIDAGFADQSHMSRHFKSTYGLTPAAWLAAVRARPADFALRTSRPIFAA